MRILFVGYNLYLGGIQRSLINVLTLLSAEKDLNIDLLLFSDKGELINEIPKNVNIIKSNSLLKITATPFNDVFNNESRLKLIIKFLLMSIVRVIGTRNYFRILFQLQKKMHSYDVAISYFNDVPGNYFNKGCNQFVTEKVVANKKIGWIHTDPIKARFSIEDLLRSYRDFDSIVTVSKAGKADLDDLIPVYKHKTSVVYNLSPKDEINKNALAYPSLMKNNITNFVTVARIDNASKRIDRIIEVANMLKMKGYRDFKWWIIGNGPDMAKNKLLSDKYELNDYIVFTGEKVNPFPYIKDADAFILASDYEGFPMVINEAITLGIPVITTSYASAEEQFKGGKEGLIVNTDTISLFEVLKSVLENKSILFQLKTNLKKRKDVNQEVSDQLKDLIYENSNS